MNRISVFALTTILVYTPNTFAEINGSCCGKWVTLSEEGFGFSRDWNCEEHLVQEPEDVVTRVCNQLLESGPDGVCPALQPVCDGSVYYDQAHSDCIAHNNKVDSEGVIDADGKNHKGFVGMTTAPKFEYEVVNFKPIGQPDITGCQNVRVEVKWSIVGGNVPRILEPTWAFAPGVPQVCRETADEWARQVQAHEWVHVQDNLKVLASAPKTTTVLTCQPPFPLTPKQQIVKRLDEIKGEPGNGCGKLPPPTGLQKKVCDRAAGIDGSEEGQPIPNIPCTMCLPISESE